VALGQSVERAMHERCGTNTHKGALFVGGLVLAARFRTPAEPSRLRPAVAEVASELLAGRRLPPSHGEEVRRRFHVGGIVREALEGLPALFEEALPAWRTARAGGLDGDRAAFAMLARLMQTVEDTTALHRCGAAGLLCLRRDGEALESLLARGEDHVAFLRRRNRAWREMHLTMGGVADLLGVACGLLVHEGSMT
jgi:triphosphoribosyl-dephospho-CoA synthetase